MLSHIRLAAVAATFVVLCLTTSALAQGTYIITDLGTLSGDNSFGFGINGSGQVTGEATTSGNVTSHAFLISPPYSSMIDLGTLGGDSSLGYAINDSGQVTGQSNFLLSGTFHAFLISPPYTNMIDLGTLGSDSHGLGINSSGQVVGYSSTPELVFHAFLISPPYNEMMDLGILGGNDSIAFGINDSGQVTGLAYLADSPLYRAFLISSPYTSRIDLGTLGGDYSAGFAINSSGQVAGNSTTADNVFQPFLIAPPYSNMTDLGTLGGAGIAFGINSSGQVVGRSATADGANHAFLYTSATGMVDLNTLLPSGSGWTLNEATGINDAGQITGTGLNPNGFTRAYLLTPTSTADLSIQKTVNKDSVRSGGVVKYVLRVENAGPDSATAVSVTDVLPATTAFHNVAHSHGNCTTPERGATGAVTCNLGTLAPGEDATINLLVRVNAAAGTTVTDTATVGAIAFDTNTANNSSSVSVIVE